MQTVAVIGCGKSSGSMEGFAIGHCHGAGIQALGKDVRLVGVDINPENLQAFGKQFALPEEQLFPSTEALYQAHIPDGVTIATWPALHHPMVMEAMEKGVKGIVCEKPLAADVGQIRELEARANEVGAVITVAHQRRYAQQFQRMKEILKSGELGDQVQVTAHVGDDWDVLSWTVHWFDMTNFLLDGPPEYVLAGMDVHLSRRYRHAVEDKSIVLADYGSRGTAQYLTGPHRGVSFGVQGSTGRVTTRADGGLQVLSERGFRKEEGADDTVEQFASLIRETLAAAAGGPEPLCSLRQCAPATEMAYAAQESARTAKAVALPLSTHFAPLEVVQHPVRSPLRGSTALLLADSHCDAGGREGLVTMLEELTGSAPRVVRAEERGLVSSDVEGADFLLLYHFQEHGEESQTLVENWVNAGKPMLVVHGALGAYKDWDAFKGWCGRIWDWEQSAHPHEACTLRPATESPIDFNWSEGWLPRDEIYVKLADVEPVVECLTAETASGSFPAAWVNRQQKNVGCWMPGHREDAFSVPAMRQGIERMLIHLSS